MPGKVYIIDDEKDFCELFKNYLSKKGYEVEIHHLLNEGLQALRHVDTGILFLDNNLPDGLGWEKITSLQEDHPDLQIHLLSGFHYAHAAIPYGNPVKIWQKPINFNDLDRYFR